MKKLNFKLKIYLTIFLIVLMTGTFGFYVFEGMSFADSAYFTVVTISTVGYGDLHPITQAGKVLSIFCIVMGVGTFMAVIANVAESIFSRREKHSIMQKLNIVIGVFFSEVGTNLLSVFSRYDQNLDTIRNDLDIKEDWTDQEYITLKKHLSVGKFRVNKDKIDFIMVKELLANNKELMLRLLENPVLLENESFTELLRSTFHLYEELMNRDLINLKESDSSHLAGDMNRVYTHIVPQWLNYMKYLNDNYPYLFMHSVRTNPFIVR
ncbi:potassium channel family protein [candidate division KSB1 bacterium]